MYVNAIGVVLRKSLAFSFVRTRTAVIDLADDPAAALDFILSPSSTSYLIQDSLYGFQTLLADAFLVRAISLTLLSY